jgi:uncharacterized protein Yka (UPF0111/DUF47 family)
VTRLFERGATFFAIVRDAALIAHDASIRLRETCDRYPEQFELVAEIERIEERGDDAVARMRAAVDGTFATPLDPRDLLLLVVGFDDVTDRIHEVAVELALFRPRALPEGARAQARVLMLACARLADAAGRLPAFDLIGHDLDDVRSLEEEGDRLRRDATAALFHSGLDALEIVRLKNVHEGLERAIDACRAIADDLATVALRDRS